MRPAPVSLFLALALALSFTGFAQGLSAQTLPQNLYYKLNEGTGTSTANSANPGVGSNPVNLPTGATWVTPGHLGAAAVDFSNSNALNTGWTAALSSSNSFTLESWIRSDAATFGYLFYFQTSPNFRVFQNSNGTLSIASTGGTPSTNITTSAIAANTWTHMALVYDAGAGTLTVYFNGSVNSSNSRTCVVSGNLIVGSNSLTSAASAWPGQIDEFRFWTTARTQAEIQANMNAELSATAPTLSPATGSSFNGSLTITQLINIPLANATLTANDSNTANIAITVASSSPAPGVTAPTSQTGVAVPFNVSFTGTPTTLGTFTYTLTLDDGTTQVPYNVTINVVNPAPTLVPSTGSAFTAARVYAATTGVPLANATLTANDTNDPNINITITPVSAAPGVTAPSSTSATAVPAGLAWTGTPTTVGSFTYSVQLSDGTNSPTFTVTINVTNPAPTLTVPTGSRFNATRVYFGPEGVPLANALLVANDTNDPNINITVTPVSAAPGVTAPATQAGAAMPSNLSWTGTPTTAGTYSYTVQLSDGTNSPSFTVTLTIFAVTALNLTDSSGNYFTPDVTVSAAYAAGEIRWYSFTLPITLTAGATAYLDVDTEGSVVADPEIGLYNISTGALFATDDQDGSGSQAALSFGSTATVRGPAVTGGVAGNGRDGNPAAATYYIAIGASNMIFGAGFGVTSTASATGSITLNLRFFDPATPVPPVLAAPVVPAAYSPVLISEVCSDPSPSGDEYVELTNVSNGNVNIAGWTLHIYDPGITPSINYTITGTSLAAGATRVFRDANGASTTPPWDEYVGANILWGGTAGGVVLRDTTGAIRDAVFFGSIAYSTITAPVSIGTHWSGATAPVFGLNNSILRTGTQDTNLASNWVLSGSGNTSIQAVNSGLTLPFAAVSNPMTLGGTDPNFTASAILGCDLQITFNATDLNPTDNLLITASVNGASTITPAQAGFVQGFPASNTSGTSPQFLQLTGTAANAGTLVLNITVSDGALSDSYQLTITITPPAPSFIGSTLTAAPSTWQYRQISYSTRLTNSGQVNSTNAALVIPVPSGANYVTGSVATTGSAANATFNSSLNRIEWGPANLNIGTDVTITFSLQVTVSSGTVAAAGTISDSAANPTVTNLGANTNILGNLPALAGTSGGYSVTDSFEPTGPTYTYTDASTTGTLLTTVTADASVLVTAPFPLYLFGTSATQISVDHDGVIIFNTATVVNPSFTNQNMNVGAQAWVIAPFWDDTNNAASGTTGVYTLVTGSAPNRRFIVEWKNMQHYSTSPSPASFQVVFTENSTDIMFAYEDVTFGDANSLGTSATVGIRGAATTDVVQYSFNIAAMADQMVVVFDGANIPPTITSTPATTGTAGVLYSYTIVASGSPAPNLSVSGNPSWLTLTGNVLSGTPTAADIGVTGTITVTAANGASPDATQPFQITVSGVAPSITSTPATTTLAGNLYSYTIVTTGQPAPTVGVTGNPAWLTLTGNVLSGTPTAADIGTTGTITITASNGQSPDASQPFQITVNGQPPQITSTAPTTATVGMLYTYTIAATGVPAPTLSTNTLPGWLSLTGNVLSGTPAITDLGLSAQIDITAANGWTPDDVESFQIQVNGVAPIITSTAPTAALVGSLYTYNISATGNPAPTFSVSGNPAWLTLSGNVLSGTPALSDMGVTGMITVTAANGQSPDDTEQFQITVTGTAPSITSTAPLNVIVGALYSYTIIATGVPAPTLSVSGQPAWLTLSGNVLSGTAPGSAIGTVGPITITATNGVSPDDTEVFSISVTGQAPVITSAALTTATSGSLYSYVVTFTGTPTPAVTVSGLPAWLTFNGTNNTISGTPMPMDTGLTGPITITATNGISPDATQIFTINVGTLGGGGGGGSGGSGGGCSTESGSSPWLLLLSFVAAAACGIRMRRSHP